MTTIGNFYLIDRGAFNVKAELNYINPDGTTGTTSSYGEIMAGQSITFDPGKNSSIENGATVTLKCDVVAGYDKTAGEAFTYQSGNPTTANYEISGITVSDHLKFLGTTTSNANVASNVLEPA